jgi:hypothetical protein
MFCLQDLNLSPDLNLSVQQTPCHTAQPIATRNMASSSQQELDLKCTNK